MPEASQPYCDLHLHTRHSDGLDTPAAVVERAKSKGFSALAITDHDTLDGVGEAHASASAAGMRFLPGVEISTSFKDRELHIVGLGVDTMHEGLRERLAWLCAERNQRAALILERLRAKGVDLAMPEAPNLGRLNIARALQQQGFTATAQEAFDRFLNAGRPAWVPKATLQMATAVELIHAAGGLAFVAHPGLSAYSRSILPEVLGLPFDGIEAYHVSHTAQMTSRFLRLARDRNLLVSGGSDCHGGAKGQIEMGRVKVPQDYFEAIVEALQGRRLQSGVISQ